VRLGVTPDVRNEHMRKKIWKTSHGHVQPAAATSPENAQESSSRQRGAGLATVGGGAGRRLMDKRRIACVADVRLLPSRGTVAVT
jgi:hypothetical protein